MLDIIFVALLVAIIFGGIWAFVSSKKEESKEKESLKKLVYLLDIFDIHNASKSNPEDMKSFFTYCFSNNYYGNSTVKLHEDNPSRRFKEICCTIQNNGKDITRENYVLFFNAIDFLYDIFKNNSFLTKYEKREMVSEIVKEYSETINYVIKKEQDEKRKKEIILKKDFEKLSKSRFDDLKSTLASIRNEEK